MRPPSRRVSRHARRLRRERTEAEDRFWRAVRDQRLGGFKFRFQHSILPFVADFACVEARLVVELDGSQHGPDVDAARTAWLAGKGWLVLRFWNNEVGRDLPAVLEAVLAACGNGSAANREQPAARRPSVSCRSLTLARFARMPSPARAGEGLGGPMLLLSLAAAAAEPATVRVRLDTSAGPITLALDARHAPKTTANFLAYVDDGRLDGTTFYRAARAKGRPGGFVEGGIGTDPRRRLDPVPLEPTSRTGLHHDDGAISMARFADPNSATGNFSILVGPSRGMDASGAAPGFAVFGRVVAGMPVVKRILALPAHGGSDVMRGQMIDAPVRIVHAVRLDGAPHPTGRPKPWLIDLPLPPAHP